LLKKYPDEKPETLTRMALARKNGIPIYFQFNDQSTMFSFISALSGYYRFIIVVFYFKLK
jgi:hypothetical protein